MAKTTVVNMTKTDDYDVLIDRRTKYGNPFKVGRDGDRATVIDKYRAWLMGHPTLLKEARAGLRGKKLGCWCKPLACHGDVLVELIDAER